MLTRETAVSAVIAVLLAEPASTESASVQRALLSVEIPVLISIAISTTAANAERDVTTLKSARMGSVRVPWDTQTAMGLVKISTTIGTTVANVERDAPISADIATTESVNVAGDIQIAMDTAPT